MRPNVAALETTLNMLFDNLLKNAFNKSYQSYFAHCLACFCALFISIIGSYSLAQSQVEIENELSVGDSDAALAEEKQIQARLQEDQKKEDESKNAAATHYENTKKKTAQIRAHIEEMKVLANKSEKKRNEYLTQIKIEQKQLSRLEKSETDQQTQLTESKKRLEVTQTKRDQIRAQITQTKEAIQKTKDDILAFKGHEHLAKSEVKTATANLAKSKKSLTESKKWRDQEVKRMSALIKQLAKDQAVIEGKIRVTSSQIKKLQDEVNASKKKNILASENHERAAALKNENDLELARLQKLKRAPAGVKPSPANAHMQPTAKKPATVPPKTSTSN